MSCVVSVGVFYFGKVLLWGDFVCVVDNYQLFGWLDCWVGESVELLVQNLDWKCVYDVLFEIYYVFFGLCSKLVLCGYFLVSCDVLQWWFLLLLVVCLEVVELLLFIGCSLLVMFNVWLGLLCMVCQVFSDEDVGLVLNELVDVCFSISIDFSVYNVIFCDFFDGQIIGLMECLLCDVGYLDVVLKQVLLVFGLLLQLVFSGGDVNVDRVLVFLLVCDLLYWLLVVVFWLDIVFCFVVCGDFELVVLICNDVVLMMVVGFNGVDWYVLCVVLDLVEVGDFLICVQQVEWVDDYLYSDYNFNCFVSYLDCDDLVLSMVCSLFGEIFLGI